MAFMNFPLWKFTFRQLAKEGRQVGEFRENEISKATLHTMELGILYTFYGKANAWNKGSRLERKLCTSLVQWISFFLRKTLFDFIKSCGGRIDLKFSGAALLGQLYSPKCKRSFFSKGKVSFSMAGSLLRVVQESFSVKEIYRWKEDRFVFFMKKL